MQIRSADEWVKYTLGGRNRVRFDRAPLWLDWAGWPEHLVLRYGRDASIQRTQRPRRCHGRYHEATFQSLSLVTTPVVAELYCLCLAGITNFLRLQSQIKRDDRLPDGFDMWIPEWRSANQSGTDGCVSMALTAAERSSYARSGGPEHVLKGGRRRRWRRRQTVGIGRKRGADGSGRSCTDSTGGASRAERHYIADEKCGLIPVFWRKRSVTTLQGQRYNNHATSNWLLISYA